MKILNTLKSSFRRSNLIRQIESSKRGLLNSSDEESIKYELELLAFRQQMRLLDN